MILRELELKNFRCFEEETFEFPNGLIGILGPNGSGKSSILEAISWVFYGSSSLRTNREELVYDGADEGATCRASLKFQFDQTGYEIERKMTGKSLSAQAYIRPANGDHRAEGFQGVTDYVQNRLVRMNEDSFFRSVFSKQNEVRQLSRGGPEKRRQLFAKLLDIERIKEARRSVDTDVRASLIRSISNNFANN
jgi:exonuclease SbcC